jgi:uncharacterized protein
MNYNAAKAFILDKLERELRPELTYHGLHHTLDVLQITKSLCAAEHIAPVQTVLLKTAALFHDSGFVLANSNHEMLGCGIVREYLPQFGYTEEAIEQICGMIMATKIPQSPQNKLEEIICDADLDYLGRKDFYSIGNTLFEELKSFGILDTIENWNKLQVKFIGAHRYFTKTNQTTKEEKKQEYLKELEKMVISYSL